MRNAPFSHEQVIRTDAHLIRALRICPLASIARHPGAATARRTPRGHEETGRRRCESQSNIPRAGTISRRAAQARPSTEHPRFPTCAPSPEENKTPEKQSLRSKISGNPLGAASTGYRAVKTACRVRLPVQTWNARRLFGKRSVALHGAQLPARRRTQMSDW